MKVNQIVSEHKKGVRAMKYGKKTKGAVPVYGPDAKDAKLKPVKPVGPGAKLDEAGDVIKQYEPGKSVTTDNPQTGVSTTVDLTKTPGALRPTDDGKLALDPTPAQSNSTTGSSGNPAAPKIAPGAPVTIADDDATVSEETPDAVQQQYVTQLTQMMQTAQQPWEKKQLEYRLKAVQSGNVPRSGQGAAIKVLPPAEWEKTTNPTVIARMIGKDGLSPEYLQKSNMLGRGLDYIGLPGQNPVNPNLKFESEDDKLLDKMLTIAGLR
jgi:hypothetical protein